MRTDRTINFVAMVLLCGALAVPARAEQDPPSAADDGPAVVKGSEKLELPEALEQSADPVNIRVAELLSPIASIHSSTTSSVSSAIIYYIPARIYVDK